MPRARRACPLGVDACCVPAAPGLAEVLCSVPLALAGGLPPRALVNLGILPPRALVNLGIFSRSRGETERHPVGAPCWEDGGGAACRPPGFVSLPPGKAGEPGGAFTSGAHGSQVSPGFGAVPLRFQGRCQAGPARGGGPTVEPPHPPTDRPT